MLQLFSVVNLDGRDLEICGLIVWLRREGRSEVFGGSDRVGSWKNNYIHTTVYPLGKRSVSDYRPQSLSMF